MNDTNDEPILPELEGPITGTRRSLDERGRRTSRSGVYAELSMLVARHTDPSRLVADACASARTLLPFNRFGLLQQSARTFQTATFYEADATSRDGSVTSRDVDIRGGRLRELISDRGIWTFAADELDDRMRSLFGAASAPQTLLTAPIEISGRVVGVLVIASDEATSYSPDDLEAVRVLAVHLGSALEVARASDEIRHLASIVQSTDVAVIAYDLGGRITSWNAAAERLLDREAVDATGQSWKAIVPSERHAAHDAGIRAAMRGEHVGQRDTVLQTRRGMLVDVALSTSPIRDERGRIVGVVDVARDITERRHAADLFRLSVESAPNAMLVVDGRGKIVLVNGEAERLFGYARADIIGRPLELLVPPGQSEGHALVREQFLANPTRRVMGAGRDLFARRNGGTDVPVEIGLTPILTPEGPMVLAAVVDITERKRFEAEQQQLLGQLREAVEARDAFLSIASHELKTPLTALQLSIQSLLRRNPTNGESPERNRAKLEAAHRQVRRLTALVTQLLDVSRIAGGRLALDCQPVDLAEVISEVVDRFQAGSDPSSGRLSCHVEGPVVGEWDRDRLDQILTNLIGNAIKYGENRPVVVTGFGGPDSVRIQVRDHGIGIEPELQARIFERFERLSPERHYGGLGLGLWIVRQLVEAHAGEIAVQSEPGRGATFVVSLPKRRPSAGEPTAGSDDGGR